MSTKATIVVVAIASPVLEILVSLAGVGVGIGVAVGAAAGWIGAKFYYQTKFDKIIAFEVEKQTEALEKQIEKLKAELSMLQARKEIVLFAERCHKSFKYVLAMRANDDDDDHDLALAVADDLRIGVAPQKKVGHERFPEHEGTHLRVRLIM